jgi:membrane protein
MTLTCLVHTGICCSYRDDVKNLIDRPSLKYPQVSAANSLRLLDRGYTLPMSIDARLEELKQNLAHLRERGGSKTKELAHAGRGREAEHPGEIPPRGWKDILWRAWAEISDQNLFLIAGGVTYAVLLALFPGLAALVSLYGLAFDTTQIEKQVAALSDVLPRQTQELLSQQLHSLVEGSSGALGFAAIVGLLLALWSASRGMSGLITAINIAYEEKERRSFLRFNLIAIGLTIGLVVGGILAIALIAVLPAAVQLLTVGSATKWLLLLVHWPLLIILVLAGLAVLYRFGPDRDKPQWRWVTPGAIAATVFWIVASVAFTVYVANFNSYDKTYGSLGGVVILLTWLYLSALMVLLGAVINAQSERQTRKDSTEGAPRAMGRRGAHAADTLGGSTD